MTKPRLSVTLLSAMLLTGAVFVSAQAARPHTVPTTPPQANARTASKSAPHPGSRKSLAEADLAAMKKPPLPAFHPQQPKRIELENGMVIFLQEDRELPLMNGTAYIRGGSVAEPAEKVGLVSVYGSAWRTGGTKTKTGDELDDLLEARAASVETGGGLDFTSLRFSCLKNDFEFVLDVLNDVLRNPEFRQEKIDLAKNALKTGIARRNDDVGGIAAREAARIGYGPASPYARVPEYATLAAVTRQDLMDWHAKYVQPGNIILGISGDFDSAAMESKLRGMFESWPKGNAYTSPEIRVTDPKPGIYFVAKNDVNQSAIQMVAPGIRRDSPDYFAVEVLNQIFGGGFTSHLSQNLRTKAGLAYAVGGGVGAAFNHASLTRLQMGTRSGATGKAIDGLYKEIENMRGTPVTPAELQLGKDGILNSFIFRLDSKEKVLLERMSYELFSYPADFLERYEKGIAAVTATDVDRVARKYLDKNKFAVLVVGKATDFDKPLDTFGPVTAVDITIPQPGTGSKNSGGMPQP